MGRSLPPVAARPRSGPRRAAPTAGPGTPTIEAAADIDRVVDAYCSYLCDKGFDDPEYWWWPRAVWVDPNQLIVDGENGSLYRVGFSTNAEQEVTFAEPIEVLETFTDLEPAAKARVLLTASRDTGNRSPVRIFASREDTPAVPKNAPEGGVPEGGNNVGMTPEQLEAIGLKADANPDEINARLAELAALEEKDGEGTGGGEGGSGEGEPTGDGGEGEGSGTGSGEGEPATGGGEGGEPAASAAQLPDGMVAVPAEVWADVQANATAGGELAAQAETTNRDNTIAAAISDGKIAPSATQSMVNLHDRDKAAFYNLLTASVSEGGLAPNLVPVNQRGSSSPSAGAQRGPAAPGIPAAPGGQVPAEAGGEYVPPEKMRALFGDAYVPATPNGKGMTVIGAE